MTMKLSRVRLEALLLASLREQPGCENAQRVELERLDGNPNWTLRIVDSGASGHQDCLMAMGMIMGDFQSRYSLTEI